MVMQSLSSCAIMTATDGSEDANIHCFKPGQPCEVRRRFLAEKMKDFSVEINETDYPFSSDEDSEEAENNEVCIDEDNGDSSDCGSS